jgi:glutaredoxin
VTIDVYSKEGCKKCDSAKEKLVLMGFDYRSHELELLLQAHDGWREDGSVEMLAAYASIDNQIPVIRIDEDFHDYPGAMSRLKALRKEAAGDARSKPVFH